MYSSSVLASMALDWCTAFYLGGLYLSFPTECVDQGSEKLLLHSGRCLTCLEKLVVTPSPRCLLLDQKCYQRIIEFDALTVKEHYCMPPIIRTHHMYDLAIDEKKCMPTYLFMGWWQPLTQLGQFKTVHCAACSCQAAPT